LFEPLAGLSISYILYTLNEWLLFFILYYILALGSGSRFYPPYPITALLVERFLIRDGDFGCFDCWVFMLLLLVFIVELLLELLLLTWELCHSSDDEDVCEDELLVCFFFFFFFLP
jgi:hypothetical protein